MAREPAPHHTGKVDKAGRIVIPAEIRAKAHLQRCATVRITGGESGRIVLELTAAIVREAQEYFKSLGPAEELWSDELLAERRLESRRECED
jgi:AbrB family looped-hinge helix DNA binding protein